MLFCQQKTVHSQLREIFLIDLVVGGILNHDLLGGCLLGRFVLKGLLSFFLFSIKLLGQFLQLLQESCLLVHDVDKFLFLLSIDVLELLYFLLQLVNNLPLLVHLKFVLGQCNDLFGLFMLRELTF